MDLIIGIHIPRRQSFVTTYATPSTGKRSTVVAIFLFLKLKIFFNSSNKANISVFNDICLMFSQKQIELFQGIQQFVIQLPSNSLIIRLPSKS